MTSYLITGAARGLGFEFVRQLSANPDNQVFALVRNKTTSEKLTSLPNKNVHVLEADIVDHKALKVAAADVSKLSGGKLDVLINNAAYIEGSHANLTLAEYESPDLLEKDLRDSFDTNVIGIIHTINSFLPLLRAGQTKKVITISSALAETDFTLKTEFYMANPYSISKAAVNMVNTKYAVQHKDEGFTFIALSPGYVNTLVEKPTLEQLKFGAKIVGLFRKYKADYEGPITPEESVTAQLKVISKVTPKDSGAFISQYGNLTWL